jgi:hypothetical protein
MGPVACVYGKTEDVAIVASRSARENQGEAKESRVSCAFQSTSAQVVI